MNRTRPLLALVALVSVGCGHPVARYHQRLPQETMRRIIDAHRAVVVALRREPGFDPRCSTEAWAFDYVEQSASAVLVFPMNECLVRTISAAPWLVHAGNATRVRQGTR